MKLIPCPLNGLRPAGEFLYGGEVREMPNPADLADRDWGAWVFLENNTAGVIREWWCHVPSGYWFVLDRDTTTDVVLGSWPVQDAPERAP